ncbi:hypothetical protein Vafri_18478 [Volvox africanus]|uniref:Uncharacterized protein n=1 Tax=Volvox africanus TaxID=51714 RepID=A0A8J4BMM3_9CHLO|nr:hypothetical protein Vafri_18478 [Volvox africanus]
MKEHVDVEEAVLKAHLAPVRPPKPAPSAAPPSRPRWQPLPFGSSSRAAASPHRQPFTCKQEAAAKFALQGQQQCKRTESPRPNDKQTPQQPQHSNSPTEAAPTELPQSAAVARAVLVLAFCPLKKRSEQTSNLEPYNHEPAMNPLTILWR